VQSQRLALPSSRTENCRPEDYSNLLQRHRSLLRETGANNWPTGQGRFIARQGFHRSWISLAIQIQNDPLSCRRHLDVLNTRTQSRAQPPIRNFTLGIFFSLVTSKRAARRSVASFLQCNFPSSRCDVSSFSSRSLSVLFSFSRLFFPLLPSAPSDSLATKRFCISPRATLSRRLASRIQRGLKDPDVLQIC